jgi:hypothetical protein
MPSVPPGKVRVVVVVVVTASVAVVPVTVPVVVVPASGVTCVFAAPVCASGVAVPAAFPVGCDVVVCALVVVFGV